MAQMRIDDRHRRIWPWVVALLLLVLLIWALALMTGRGGEVKVRDDGNRLGAVRTPTMHGPSAGGEADRKAEDRKADDEERERVLRMRTRMTA